MNPGEIIVAVKGNHSALTAIPISLESILFKIAAYSVIIVATAQFILALPKSPG